MKKQSKTKVDFRKELVTINTTLQQFNNRISFLESSIYSLVEILETNSIIELGSVDNNRILNVKTEYLKAVVNDLKANIDKHNETSIVINLYKGLTQLKLNIADIKQNRLDLTKELNLDTSKLIYLTDYIEDFKTKIKSEVCSDEDSDKCDIISSKCDNCDKLKLVLAKGIETLKENGLNLSSLDLFQLITEP